MKTLPLAEVKANFSQLIDQVVKRDEQILITRNGRPAAVLVSADEYDSLCETVAIRSDRELMALRSRLGGTLSSSCSAKRRRPRPEPSPRSETEDPSRARPDSKGSHLREATAG